MIQKIKLTLLKIEKKNEIIKYRKKKLTTKTSRESSCLLSEKSVLQQNYITNTNKTSPISKESYNICSFFPINVVYLNILWSDDILTREIRIKHCTQNITLCNQVYQLLAGGRWFSPVTAVSSINKTDRHNTTEILWKVTLYTITLSPLCINYKKTRTSYLPHDKFFICEHVNCFSHQQDQRTCSIPSG